MLKIKTLLKSDTKQENNIEGFFSLKIRQSFSEDSDKAVTDKYPKKKVFGLVAVSDLFFFSIL